MGIPGVINLLLGGYRLTPFITGRGPPCRWWFQKIFFEMFTPNYLGKWSNLMIFCFQTGWNHQLENVVMPISWNLDEFMFCLKLYIFCGWVVCWIFSPRQFCDWFCCCVFFVLYLPCRVGTGKLIFNGIGKLTCITGCNIHQEKDACSQPWWEIITSLYTVFGRSTTVGGFSSAFEDFHVDFRLLGFSHQLCDLLFSPLARLSCFLWIGF